MELDRGGRWYGVTEKLQVTNDLTHMCYRDWSVLLAWRQLALNFQTQCHHRSLLHLEPIIIMKTAAARDETSDLVQSSTKKTVYWDLRAKDWSKHISSRHEQGTCFKSHTVL